jgi:hypothetical protein
LPAVNAQAGLAEGSPATSTRQAPIELLLRTATVSAPCVDHRGGSAQWVLETVCRTPKIVQRLLARRAGAK